jgi:hypothetical protein
MHLHLVEGAIDISGWRTIYFTRMGWIGIKGREEIGRMYLLSQLPMCSLLMNFRKCAEMFQIQYLSEQRHHIASYCAETRALHLAQRVGPLVVICDSSE